VKTVDFVAYDIGTLYASVCSSLTPEETAERMNLANPNGQLPPWRIATEVASRGGRPNPYPCPQDPRTHKHYLMICREEAPCPE